MTATNLWEADRLRKLKTVDAVEAEIARCEFGQKNAPSPAKIKDWGRKLHFLDKLLRERRSNAPDQRPGAKKD